MNQDSRFFTVLAAAIGLVAVLLALAGASWGVIGVGLVTFALTGVGLFRGEGPGALVGAGLVVSALLGPAAVALALLAGGVFFGATRRRIRPRG